MASQYCSNTKEGWKDQDCVNYRDLNKASPKDNFPLPNIHILIDNCARHENAATYKLFCWVSSNTDG